MGLRQYVPWIQSDANCCIRFETLYQELENDVPVKQGAIDRICEFLNVNRPAQSRLNAILFRSLTASPRKKKVGIYQDVFTPKQMDRVKASDFMELRCAFGYE